MSMTLEQVRQYFEQEFKGFTQLLEKQAAEIRQHGETSTATAQAIKAAEARLLEVNEHLKAAQQRLDDLEAKLNEVRRPPLGGREGEEYKSPGQLFVESEAYKSMLGSRKYTSDPVYMKSLFGRKNLTSDPASGGALVQPQRYPEVIAPQVRALRVRDLIPAGTTTSNAIEYVEETGYTNAAAPVAEGGTKPQTSIAFTLKTVSVQTIAHWIPASRQILADAPQLQSYIDTRLVEGLKLVEENQILYGNGTAPNLQGIMTHPNVQTYRWSQGKVGDTKLDAVRRAITKARLAEYPVTGVVLHPSDWEDIELAKGSDGKYIWVNVPDGGVPRLWRVPVVDTTAMQVGDFLVGAFSLGAMIWDREEALVRIAEQHADFFAKNMVAILAEERLALTIFRPEAFVSGEFDAAPTGT